jgi:hypothetical protein
MGYRQVFNRFTRGELDPRLIAQVDLDFYQKGARRALNVVGMPQGGLTKCFGSKYIDIVKDRIGGTEIYYFENYNLFEYEFEASELYVCVIRPDVNLNVFMDIYRDDQFRISLPLTAFAFNQIKEIRWVFAANRVILLHPDVKPQMITRLFTDNFNIADFPFSFYPSFDYSLIDGNIVPYKAAGFTFTPSAATGAVTLTASGNIFTGEHVGGLYLGNAGVLRITAYTSPTQVDGYTIEDFTDTSAIRGDESFLGAVAWSQQRGWPAHGDVFQGRLYFGGWRSVPNLVSASEVKAFYSFNDALPDANYGFTFEAGRNSNDVVNDIVATKTMVVPCFNGVSSTSILLEEPTTPTNIFATLQGTEGSANIDAQFVDNQVMYVSSNKQNVYSMFYDVPNSGYSIINTSLFSNHLIKNPVWMATFDPDNFEGRYVLVVNADGSMAVLQSIAEQNISSWTEVQTRGSYLRVSGSNSKAHALVRRKVNNNTPNVGIPVILNRVSEDFTAFLDISESINTGVVSFPNTGDYLLVGDEIQFQSVQISLVGSANPAMTFTVEYLNFEGRWEEVAGFSLDGTLGFTQSGPIIWDPIAPNAWTPQSLDGVSNDRGVLINSLYWIRIKRTNSINTIPTIFGINNNTENKVYLERLEFGRYMDCEIEATADGFGDVTTLQPLRGQNVFCYGNNYPLGTFYCLDGTIETEVANARCVVGIEKKPLVIPMPVVVFLVTGLNAYKPEHINEIHIDYYESLGMTVDGQQVNPVDAGVFLSQTVPNPKTGVFKVNKVGGWDPRQVVTVSQSYPGPFNLLGLCLSVEVT